MRRLLNPYYTQQKDNMMSTTTKVKRFLVTYKNERQFLNVADHDEAARIMYRGLLAKQFGAEKKAKAENKPFEADLNLDSFVTFKRLAVSKESPRY